MDNSVYKYIIESLSSFLGSKSDLSSNNGARFNKKNIILTVYNTNLASGNCVEIAFKPETLSEVNAICSLIKNPTKPNPRYNWPRVGLRNIEEAKLLVTELRKYC